MQPREFAPRPQRLRANFELSFDLLGSPSFLKRARRFFTRRRTGAEILCIIIVRGARYPFAVQRTLFAVQCGSAAVQCGSAAVQCSSAAVQSDSAAVQFGSAAVQFDSAAVQSGSAAVQSGSAVAQCDSAAVQFDSTVAQRGFDAVQCSSSAVRCGSALRYYLIPSWQTLIQSRNVHCCQSNPRGIMVGFKARLMNTFLQFPS